VLAYPNQRITDEQVNQTKDAPIWFVYSQNDTTTVPDETMIPKYNRLIALDASNEHFSYYEHVIDLTVFMEAEEYYFSVHWSWNYSHANVADFGFNEKPVQLNSRRVTLMEWWPTKRSKYCPKSH